MAKQSWKAGTMLYPLPTAMVSCGTMEKSNIITAAWTGTASSDPPMAYVSIRPERYSYAIIKESGEFVINLTTEHLTFAADYCGMKSGREIKKFSACRLTPVAATQVASPLIAESPINIECRVKQIIALGSHDMFLANVLAVNVDEKLLDGKGVLQMERAGLVAYVHGKYMALGRQLGKFGFSVQKR